MQGAVALDGESRHSAVDQCDGARIEFTAIGRHILLDADLGVVEVGDQLSEAAGAGHDEHRQSQRRTQVGVGLPHLAEPSRGRHEHPGLAGLSELSLKFDAEARIGGRKHLRGERVVIRAAEGDAGVRQVGVDRQVPVAGVAGDAAGGRHPGADQRDHQIAR